MECPLCGKVHEIEERRRNATLLIKGELVDYEELYYYCSNSKEYENEFETSKLTNANLMNARNSYRMKKGFLTSNEIVAIREKYGLSQVELAKLMGWGEATISRYESKAIQDEAYDNMLRIIKDDSLKALEYLEKNQDKFAPLKRYEIKQNIMKELDSNGKEFLARQSLKGTYAMYEEPSVANGFTLLDIEKVESAISYYAERIADLYKVKLMKLLWYADSVAYSKNGRSITGLVYRHNKMGALPVGHNQLLTLEKVDVREEESIYGTKYSFYRHRDVDLGYLEKDEIEILDKVISKFANYSTQEIVDYMHEEIAYKETASGDVISFELAKLNRVF